LNSSLVSFLAAVPSALRERALRAALPSLAAAFLVLASGFHPAPGFAQAITTVSGQYVAGGTGGFSGDGGAASAAQVRFPSGSAVDLAGNLYVADAANHVVRKITKSGGAFTTIATIAGKKDAAGAGVMGFSGDGGPATDATLAFPSAVAVDPFGNVYIADTGNHRIRKVGVDGKISTVAGAVDGNGVPVAGYSASAAKASTASLYYPSGVAVSAGLDLYVADTYNHVIRKVNTFTDVITTVAGAGVPGYLDSTPGASQFRYPQGVAFDSEGRLYIADTGNNRVRRFEELYQQVETVAGNGAASGNLGDGGPATSAVISAPFAVSLDARDNLYVADWGNQRIRFVSISSSLLISTVAGGGTALGEGGDPLAASLASPRSVTLDKYAGLVVLSDTNNQLIRSVVVSASLVVGKGGNGSGRVTSNVGGIDCGPTCFRSVAEGTVVTLTAAAAEGSQFLGWVGAGCSGTGTCQVTASAGSITEVFAYFQATGQAQLSNLSTRGPVLTGDEVMIGGFTIGGTTPKKVLIVTRGPSLAAFGVTGPLGNPALTLYSGQNAIAANDDWQSNPNQADIAATGLAPTSTLESALLLTLNPGAYTAVVSGVSGATGVALVEVYQQDNPGSPLVNLSTRGKVETADRVMIGGFVIQGTLPRQVLVTARGPSLAAFGVANTLSDPKIDLYSGQNIIASNDDWQTNANAGDISGTGVAPTNPKESALLLTLNPGAYTAIVSGVGGGVGVAIVEIFAK